jgi:hypothetical protein
MLTQDELKRNGCKHMSWNGGVIEEWYLPIARGSALGMHGARLGVRFNEHPDDPVKVYIFFPSTMVRLEYVTNIDDFLTMYRLLTGKTREVKRAV